LAISDDRDEGVGAAEAETLAAEAQRAATRQRANDPYAALRFRDLAGTSTLARIPR
jgi:hypothetical protein